MTSKLFVYTKHNLDSFLEKIGYFSDAFLKFIFFLLKFGLGFWMCRWTSSVFAVRGR